jgi:glucokinase
MDIIRLNQCHFPAFKKIPSPEPLPDRMLSVLKPIAKWPSTGRIPLCFGGDVGGSGIRIRLSSTIDRSLYLDLPHIKVRSAPGLAKVISEVGLSVHSVHPSAEFRGAALALAGPIRADQSVTLTNWPGSLPDRTIRLADLPSLVFPRAHSAFLNDLEAGTYGILSAHKQGILPSYFEQLWPDKAPRGPLVSETRTAVFAMGSGLGVGLLVQTGAAADPVVLPTELGHLGIPLIGAGHPNFASERALLEHASRHWSDGRYAPEFEDLASGRGLCLCYQFVIEQKVGRKLEFDKLDGAVIAETARAGDELAKEAVALQHFYLIRAAKIAATAFTCDSILFALDNAVLNNYILHVCKERFKAEFYEFVRPDWLTPVRVYSQTKILNFNIIGADYIAHALAVKK